MKNSILRGLMVTVAVLAVLVCAPAAWGQRHCMPVTGTTLSFFTGSGWAGTADFEIGGQALHAEAQIIPGGLSKGGPLSDDKTWIGTEMAVFTFDDGSTLEMTSRWTGVHMGDLFLDPHYVNETGTITGGTGKFTNASGHITTHGPYPWSWDVCTLVFDGWYQGNICGADL